MSTSRRPPRMALAGSGASERGFTLFELLVSVTLFSLITVAIVTAIRVGAHSWEAGDSASGAAHELRLVTGLLRRHLRRAYPVVIVDRGRPELVFEGGEEQLSFVATVAPYLGVGGPYRISISVAESQQGSQLVFGRELFHVGARSPTGESDESVLVDDLVEVKFSYYGAKNRKDEDPDWYVEWRDAERLPALIRVSISSKESGAWPDVVVPLVLDGARHVVRIRRSLTDDEQGDDEGDDGFEDDYEEQDAPLDEEAA